MLNTAIHLNECGVLENEDSILLKCTVLYLLGLNLLVSCSKKVIELMISETPPNGILVQENFYCDQTKVTS